MNVSRRVPGSIVAVTAALAFGFAGCGESDVERGADDVRKEAQEAGRDAKKTGEDAKREAEKRADEAKREIEK